MARWYSTFDNSVVAALEGPGQRRQRRTMTNGPALRTALIDARDALSVGALATIDPVNQDGSLGIVVPADILSVGGGNVSWANLYTNTGAIWTANPETRPLAQILAAASVAVTPTDAGSVSESLYNTARTAVEDVLSAMTPLGPRGRLGLDRYKTLASLHHDHALTYFAWDDFTPGQPTFLSFNEPTSQPASDSLIVSLTWAQEFPSDSLGETAVAITLTQTNGANSTFQGADVAAGLFTRTFTVAANTLPPGLYRLDASAFYRDNTVTAHEGVARFATSGPSFPWIELT